MFRRLVTYKVGDVRVVDVAQGLIRLMSLVERGYSGFGQIETARAPSSRCRSQVVRIKERGSKAQRVRHSPRDSAVRHLYAIVGVSGVGGRRDGGERGLQFEQITPKDTPRHGRITLSWKMAESPRLKGQIPAGRRALQMHQRTAY